MELLDPLAAHDVRVPARDVLDRPPLEEHAVHAAPPADSHAGGTVEGGSTGYRHSGGLRRSGAPVFGAGNRWRSPTAVFRPGTFLACRALTSTTSTPRPSRIS